MDLSLSTEPTFNDTNCILTQLQLSLAHQWTLRNYVPYLNMPQNQEACFESTSFSLLSNPEVRFHLKLYPQNVYESKDYLSIYLVCESDLKGDTAIEAQYKFSIIGLNGVKCHTKDSNVVQFKSNNRTFGFQDYITNMELKNNSSQQLPGDDLKVCVEVYYNY